MPYKSLRFASGQELYEFRSRLQRDHVIDMSTEDTSKKTIASLTPHFVRGVDRGFYRLDDLERLPPGVTNSKDQFFYVRSSAEKPQKVTLKQLLAEVAKTKKSPLYDAKVLNCISLLISLNTALYHDSFPELMRSDNSEIKSFAESWRRDMAVFYDKLKRYDAEIAEIKAYIEANRVPHHALPIDFINYLTLDILNITFFQQERFYAELLKLKLNPDFREHEPILNVWLSEITENNQKIKAYLESYRTILDKSRGVYEHKVPDVHIVLNQLKNQQTYNLLLNILRIIISLAMISTLHWYSAFGGFTLLLLFVMFQESVTIDHIAAFIVSCLFSIVLEPVLVCLSAMAIGCIIIWWAKVHNDATQQLNTTESEYQQVEEYVACRSIWSELLNHFDVVINRMDNFLSEKQSRFSGDQIMSPSNQEEVLVSLEKNNPGKPFLPKRCQDFSDITFFSRAKEVDNSLPPQESAQETGSVEVSAIDVADNSEMLSIVDDVELKPRC
ncbi:hypothetical protein [Legionella rowbothamii]|uniref:hypothetical protein n=1 Tax=Legionella rowbothamii TaxID=96229 RepID=UPI001056546A|nr:hypothetical protein [Legionella rowbothamii]